MLQSPRLKYHTKNIGIYQSLINSDIFEHIYIKNIKKLYKHAGKCDKQQQFKDILEANMIYNTEGFIDNSTISITTPPTLKKQSARKSLCIFTKIFYVKNKTAIR